VHPSLDWAKVPLVTGDPFALIEHIELTDPRPTNAQLRIDEINARNGYPVPQTGRLVIPDGYTAYLLEAFRPVPEDAA